jgi:hypothetical protein
MTIVEINVAEKVAQNSAMQAEGISCRAKPDLRLVLNTLL